MKTVVSEPRDIEELLARSAVYRALAMVLRHPDDDTRKWLAAREHHRLLEVMALGSNGEAGLREAARRLAAALDAASMAEWSRDYERIFGHSVQSAAPPYELEYGEEHSHRQPQELGDITAFYQAFGLRASFASHERVDHIATECEFLHYLLYKHACAVDEEAAEHAQVCDAATRQFLADHLGRWGPAFCLRLSRAAGSGIEGAAATMVLGWLSQECARMGVPLGSCDLPLRSPTEQDAVGCAACALPQGKPANGC